MKYVVAVQRELHCTPYSVPFPQSFIMVPILFNLITQNWYSSFAFPLFYEYKHGKRQEQRRLLINIQIRKQIGKANSSHVLFNEKSKHCLLPFPGKTRVACNFTKNQLVHRYLSNILSKY